MIDGDDAQAQRANSSVARNLRAVDGRRGER